jgi:hypothetical protein
MSKTDYKQLAADKAELQEVWNFLELPGEFPTKQLPLWLLDYGKDMIESAFKVLKQKEDKITDPVAYIGVMLRNSKKRGMTPEQRTTEISQMRSVIATVREAKKHDKEIKQLKAEFAEVCDD